MILDGQVAVRLRAHEHGLDRIPCSDMTIKWE